MAAAFFNALADPRKATAISAGTAPVEKVHPEVQAAMRSEGFEMLFAVLLNVLDLDHDRILSRTDVTDPGISRLLMAKT